MLSGLEPFFREEFTTDITERQHYAGKKTLVNMCKTFDTL
jgi:hypothetical protein